VNTLYSQLNWSEYKLLIRIDDSDKREFLLEALDRDVKKEDENPSIGVLLCRKKNDEVVKYALSRSLSPTELYEIYKLDDEIDR